MPYVSARYAPPDPTGFMEPKLGALPVIATDDQGVEWQLTEDSLVGDWLRFVEAGGQIASARDAPKKRPAKKGK